MSEEEYSPHILCPDMNDLEWEFNRWFFVKIDDSSRRFLIQDQQKSIFIKRKLFRMCCWHIESLLFGTSKSTTIRKLWSSSEDWDARILSKFLSICTQFLHNFPSGTCWHEFTHVKYSFEKLICRRHISSPLFKQVPSFWRDYFHDHNQLWQNS